MENINDGILLSTKKNSATTFIRQLTSYPAFFIYILLLYLFYLPTSGYTDLPYDASYYWYASTTFIKNGIFSISNFEVELRGVLFPLLYFPLSWSSEKYNIAPILLTRLIGAFQAATLFGLVLPKLWEIITDSKQIHWARRAAFALISFFLWKDYFNFSLSDFPAVLAISSSLLIILKRKNLVFFLVAGIILAFGVNFRPVYMIVIPAFLLILWFPKTADSWMSKSILKTTLLALGFVIGCIPQIIVNLEKGQFSLFTSSDYRGESLYIAQLNWGLIYQKYETSLLWGKEGAMPFREPAGIAILNEQKLSHIFSYQEYLDLFAKYPLDFVGIYFRHLFNGLDLQYASPYPLMPFKTYWGIMILNFSILFIASVILLYKWPTATSITYKKVIALIMIALPCLVVIPVAIECRFLLPLHLLLYAIVCFNFPKVKTLTKIKLSNLTRLVVLYLFFMAGCFAMSSNAQVQLESEPKLYRK